MDASHRSRDRDVAWQMVAGHFRSAYLFVLYQLACASAAEVVRSLTSSRRKTTAHARVLVTEGWTS